MRHAIQALTNGTQALNFQEWESHSEAVKLFKYSDEKGSTLGSGSELESAALHMDTQL